MGHFPSVIMVHGDLRPGILHAVILTNYSLNRSYRKINNISVDVNLRDIGPELIKLLSQTKYNFVSLKRNVIVEGRSWEMAAVHALHNVNGVFSGTVIKVTDGKSYFGEVPAVTMKSKIYKNLITSLEVPWL
jgi:hypothetical protein